MGRPLRIEHEGAWYYVMNRGRGRQAIFPGEAGYEAFLETVAEACRRFRLAVHAYCLMPNHYPLLVRTPLGNLSRVMRCPSTASTPSATTGLRKRTAHCSGVATRPFLVDKDAYLLERARSIGLNPVRVSLTEEAREWPWSSYRATAGLEPCPQWLRVVGIRAALARPGRRRPGWPIGGSWARASAKGPLGRS